MEKVDSRTSHIKGASGATISNTAYEQTFSITPVIVHIEPPKIIEYTFTKIFQATQILFAHNVHYEHTYL